MKLSEFFESDGLLARTLASFEFRAGQKAMAEAVANTLAGEEAEGEIERSSQLLVVEAETGIGKTLAYLIPAVLSGKRVVVSTATLNLQDQIVDKDLPLVARLLQREVPAICLKGRQNYLCLYRWYQYRSSWQGALVDNPQLARMDAWLAKTETGDRSEVGWLGENFGLWSRITAKTGQCLGGDCPEAALCFINRLRKKAGSAQLIIVNHHLFFSDLALRKEGYGELLPRYEAVIFDEAHHLENTATIFFGRSFSQYQVLDLLFDVEHQAQADLSAKLAAAWLGEIAGLKIRLESFAGIFPEQYGRYPLAAMTERLSVVVWREEVDLLAAGMSRFAERLSVAARENEGWTHLAKRADELRHLVVDIALGCIEENRDYVYWYEKRDRSIALSATPIAIAGALNEHLYSKVKACILASATLSSGGDFTYIRESLGLDEKTEYRQFASPFDYRNQAMLYIPEQGFPEPTTGTYIDRLCQRTLEILELSAGRALILCTSIKIMEALAEYLSGHWPSPLLVQGQASRKSLLRKFTEDTHSVLIAVASFWEGIDVVGEALSCVIIDKLPFEVPSDPVLQARIARIKEEGGNPFSAIQVPRAILTLRQGVGRLIRSSSDRGVIAIMDVRLFTKGYGRTFLKSLPSSPVTRELDDVMNFFSH